MLIKKIKDYIEFIKAEKRVAKRMKMYLEAVRMLHEDPDLYWQSTDEDFFVWKDQCFQDEEACHLQYKSKCWLEYDMGCEDCPMLRGYFDQQIARRVRK